MVLNPTESIKTNPFVAISGTNSESPIVRFRSYFAIFSESSFVQLRTFTDKSESSLVAFSISGVFSIVINDAFQIFQNEWTGYVQVKFQVTEFSVGSNISLVGFEYSTNGGVSWSNGTLDSNHANSDTTFPYTTSSTVENRNIVWDAIGDLGEGKYSLVKIRLTISNGSKTINSEFTVETIQKFYGMGDSPPTPRDLAVVNVDDDPIPLVDLQWTVVQNSDLYNNFFTTNDIFCKTNEGIYVSVHNWTVTGYRLYRDLSSSFTPPSQGTLVADENSLTQSVNTYQDQSVSQGTVYYYKIGTVI